MTDEARLETPTFVELSADEIRQTADPKVLQAQAGSNTRQLRELLNTRDDPPVEAVEAWLRAQIAAEQRILADPSVPEALRAPAAGRLAGWEERLRQFATDEGLDAAVNAYLDDLDAQIQVRRRRQATLKRRRVALDLQERQERIEAERKRRADVQQRLGIDVLGRRVAALGPSAIDLVRDLEGVQYRIADIGPDQRAAWQGLIRNVGTMIELARRTEQLWNRHFGPEALAADLMRRADRPVP